MKDPRRPPIRLMAHFWLLLAGVFAFTWLYLDVTPTCLTPCCDPQTGMVPLEYRAEWVEQKVDILFFTVVYGALILGHAVLRRDA